MEYTRTGNDIIARLDKGDKIKESLAQIAKAEQIQSGFVSGIGAVDQAELSFFQVDEKKYDTVNFEEEFEVLSLNGTLSTYEDKPHQHIHIVLGRSDFSTTGGHLQDATVNITLELDIKILVGVEVERKTNEELGIQTLNFEDK